MSWNGSGTFARLYSWVADAAAGIDISSTRMDSDTNDITSNGFGNCLTRDGQGIATANLPMGNFRHTGVGNGVNRTDYTALGQTQDGLINWAIAGGSSDALTATYSPALTALVDGQLCWVRAIAANTTITPTFAPNGLTARVITKTGGAALGIGDIVGSLQELILRYNLANTRWELLNPVGATAFSTGDVKLTLKNVVDPGWLFMQDGTIGNVSSGANYANANALQLYTLIWTNVSNTFAPVSGGRGVSAAADWAAQKTIALTKVLGRALAVAGAGSGLSGRFLGETVGEETHLLVAGEVPIHAHTFSGTTTGVSANHTHTESINPGGTSAAFGGNFTAAQIGSGGQTSIESNDHTHNYSGTTSSFGSSGTHNNMQPSSFMNVMIKL